MEGWGCSYKVRYRAGFSHRSASEHLCCRLRHRSNQVIFWFVSHNPTHPAKFLLPKCFDEMFLQFVHALSILSGD